MPTINYSVSIAGLGGSITRAIPRTADGGIVAEIALPAGKTGTLSTRTDNETGTLTMASGHGLTTGQIIDLYWTGGARYGITVGSVSVNSVPIGADNLGTGSILPSAATAIVACVQVSITVSIDGDLLSLLAIQNAYSDTNITSASRIGFLDADATVIASVALAGSTPRVWDIIAGDTNSFTGNPILSAVASNGSSASASLLKIYGVQDASP